MATELYRFRNKADVSPADTQPNDAFAIKIVATVGFANDWAAYEGPSNWSDQRVASEGNKIDVGLARRLFFVLGQSGRSYRY